VYKFVYLEDYLNCPKYVGTDVKNVLPYILCCISYLLTGSMEQSPFRETNQFSASQEISPLYGTQISLQHSQVPVRILSPYQWINPGLRHQFIFHNMIRFYGEELFAHHQNPKLDCHPLLAVHDCLFNIFKATLHI